MSEEAATFKIVLEAGASLAAAYASRPAPAAPARPATAAPAPTVAPGAKPTILTAAPAPTVAPGAKPTILTAAPAPVVPPNGTAPPTARPSTTFTAAPAPTAAPGAAPAPVGAAKPAGAAPTTAAPLVQTATAKPITAAPAAPLATAEPCDCICQCITRALETIGAGKGMGGAPMPTPAKLTGGPEDQEQKKKRPEVLTAKDLAAGIGLALARTTVGHAQAFGRALGGSEGGIGVAGTDAGLELAQQIAPMFGPAGAVVGGAAKAVAVGLEMVEAASKQAAKNIGAFGSMEASLLRGDILTAQRKYYEKEDEEHGATATIKDALFFGAMAEPIKKWFSALPINGPAKAAAGTGVFQAQAGEATARANELAPFSAALSMATAQARVQQIQTAVKLAQGPLGKSAAKFVAAQGDYKTAADTVLADRQAKKFDELTKAYQENQIGKKEYLQKLEELSKKTDLKELLTADTADAKEYRAKMLKEMERARKAREGKGKFNMQKLIDDFLKRGDMLPQMPPDNPFQQAPMQPLQI